MTGEFCHDKEFFVVTDLDRLGRFSVATKLAKEGKFLSRRKVIMLRHSCPIWGEFMSQPSILTL